MPCVRNACRRVHQRFAGVIEVLEDRLESFRRHRLDADKRATDVRLAHGVQELRVLGRFHRDLRA